MLSFIFRFFIVIVVFLGGIFVGNLYMPQKQLEHMAITSISEPKTILNLTKDANIESTLRALAQMEEALSATEADAELLFGWTDTLKRTILLQAYKTAKADYELALLTIQTNPDQSSHFIKARDNYFKIKNLIETTFPVKEEQIEILPATNGAAKQEATEENKKTTE